MKTHLFTTLFVAVCSSALAGESDFGRKIRPLLAEKCFSCHGLDEESRETEFRLDTKEGMYGEVDSGGNAIVPGDPESSVVFQRLISEDADLRMPPAEVDPLTDEEIESIRLWIKDGAQWEQHWSLVAPQLPKLPEVAAPSWPRNPIDHFILARLEAEGLKPSSEAAKETLIRRVTFDLTGLPPTLQEIDNYLADTSDNAYEKVVDRLLESQHYGEHQARYWLDAARYADTHGLHLDNFRMIWPYRNWVINAFNKNMPFDQFTIEQLAGDLLPNATPDQKIATGFNRCNVTTSEGGVIPEEYYVHYTNDRVATTSTVWMGLSMGCVVCHDHKFDPFTMKDFYQLFAFFNSLDGPVMDGNKQDTPPVARFPGVEQAAELEALDNKIASLQLFLESPHEQADLAQVEWEDRVLKQGESSTDWRLLSPASFTSSGGATLTKLEDESILASEKNPDKEVYELTSQFELGKVTAIRLEGLLHESLTSAGAGRSSNSNVVLTEFEAEFLPEGDSGEWRPIKFESAWADYEQDNGDFKVANAIDGKTATGWAIGGHQKKEDRIAIFVPESPFGDKKGGQLRVRLKHESVFAKHQFGRIRLAITASEAISETGTATPPDEIIALLAIEREKRDGTQAAQIREHYRANVTTVPEVVEVRKQLAETKKRKGDLEKAIPTTLVWSEMAEPKPAFILTRGAYDKQGERVYRDTPAALPPLTQVAENETPNRLHLAQWLVSPEHPLTARVTVNRIWQQYFGIGIVETAEDFGSQGTQPTHPGLLDWLAVDFRENGWDVKRFHKLIVMSSTYRQSSKMSPELIATDPENGLLARGPRFRLDAEVVRDSALANSRLLVRRVGGPSVKPYQPPGIWYAVGYTNSNTARFSRDNGDALYRRSMYTFWKRTAPPPTMATLDAPSRETCTVRRSRTNTPLAALALMNDEQFVEASRAFAQRILLEGGETESERAAFGFRVATGRRPSDAELAVLLDVFQANLKKYQSDQDAAEGLIAVGASEPPEELDAAELAAWTMVANMILNLDETITKG